MRSEIPWLMIERASSAVVRVDPASGQQKANLGSGRGEAGGGGQKRSVIFHGVIARGQAD